MASLDEDGDDLDVTLGQQSDDARFELLQLSVKGTCAFWKPKEIASLLQNLDSGSERRGVVGYRYDSGIPAEHSTQTRLQNRTLFAGPVRTPK